MAAPQTLAAPASYRIEVKHSRFLARAVALETPDSAATALTGLREADATHNGWAWRFGDQYRSGDDGEPAGTAGRPILAAIDGRGYDRVLVVVTRWYGGVKLGAGGLVRAYGGAAAECLRRAQGRPLIDCAELELHCAFAEIGSVHALLDAAGAEKLEERFDADGVALRLRLPAERLDGLKNRLRDATRDRVRFAPSLE